MLLTFQHNEDLLNLHAEPDGNGGWRVRLPDGTEHHITARRLPDDVLRITDRDPETTGERTFLVPFARTEHGVEFARDGQTYGFTAATTTRTPRRKRDAASGSLVAPMVGTVVNVLVEEGQAVEAYQPLAVIEAMKVMATLDAPFAGTVTKVYVQPTDRVAHGAPIVDIIPHADAEKGNGSTP